MGLREEKKRRTRQEILATAEACFRAEGFDATRMRDIAARLSLSEQTVFNYFASKEALLDALASDWFRSLPEQARAAGPEGARLSVDGFLARVRGLVRAIAADRDFMALVFSRAPLLRDAGADFEANFAMLRGLFAALQQSGALRSDLEAQEIAEYYVTLFNASVARGLAADATPAELEARVDRALRVLFRGLRDEEAA